MAAQFLGGFGRPPGVLAGRHLVPRVRPASGLCRTARCSIVERGDGGRSVMLGLMFSIRTPAIRNGAARPPATRAPASPAADRSGGMRWSAGRPAVGKYSARLAHCPRRAR